LAQGELAAKQVILLNAEKDSIRENFLAKLIAKTLYTKSEARDITLIELNEFREKHVQHLNAKKKIFELERGTDRNANLIATKMFEDEESLKLKSKLESEINLKNAQFKQIVFEYLIERKTKN
jgi:hypothetical protein